MLPVKKKGVRLSMKFPECKKCEEKLECIAAESEGCPFEEEWDIRVEYFQESDAVDFTDYTFKLRPGQFEKIDKAVTKFFERLVKKYKPKEEEEDVQ